MINLFSPDIDSIPFFLKKEIVTCIDSIPENEFLSYQFLSLDSTKIFYKVDTINQQAFISGIEGLVRPFMQQFGSVLFLAFTLLFVLSALVFRTSGDALFSNFNYIFTFGSRNKNSYSQQITTSDIWTNLFCVFQALVIYSILFFDLTLERTSLFSNWYDYIVLFSQIFVVISLFILGKYILYKLMGVMFSNTKTNGLIDVYLWVICLTGILSFIPIVAYIYIPEMKTYVLFFLLAVFIVGRITVFIKSFSFFVKSHIGILYFFVYLCGVEIMPYMLLYKAIVLIN